MCIASGLILRVGLMLIMVMRWTEIGMSAYCVWTDIKGCTHAAYVEQCMWVLRCCVLRVCVCVREQCMYAWMIPL